MKIHLLTALTFLIHSCLPIKIFSQPPVLGSAGDFVLFSSVGAVGNTGISQLTGNVGTNDGAITGFGNVNGVMHNANAITAQTVTDLLSAWHQIDTATATATHGPVLGNGEVLYPGVYSIAAAGSLVSVLTLDAQGDSNAVFIFKTGGAFTSAASSTVSLVNGAIACNVFWKAEGAISLAALTTMKGTLIAHPGAIDFGDGCSFEGRALSTTGAVSVYGTIAFIPPGCSRPMLTGPLAPNLGALECFALFSSDDLITNSGITNVIGDIGSNSSSPSGYDAARVTGTIHTVPDTATSLGASAFSSVYGYLDTISFEIELLYPAQFGNDLVLTPHTYLLNSAVTFTNILYLNAEDNADAIFIIRVNGAFSAGASSEVRLINGAQAKNVYWKVDGEVNINANAIFNGTIINNAVVNLATGMTLNGRSISSGALNTVAVTINKPSGCSFTVLPVRLISFTGQCEQQTMVLKWSIENDINNRFFSIERGTGGSNWQEIGRIEDLNSSLAQSNYSFADKFANNLAYYRIKQTSSDGKFTYFRNIVAKNCADDTDGLTIYPSPSTGIVNLLLRSNQVEIESVSIYNLLGKRVYHSMVSQSTINLSDMPSGIYFLYLKTPLATLAKKFVIKR
jgi:hypothetical protein